MEMKEKGDPRHHSKPKLRISYESYEEYIWWLGPSKKAHKYGARMQLGVFKSGSVCIAAMGAQWSVLRSFKSFLGTGPRSIYSFFLSNYFFFYTRDSNFELYAVFCVKQFFSADGIEFLYNCIVCNSAVQQHS